MTFPNPQLTLPTQEDPAKIFRGSHAVQSMRDSGYKATEKALAELIDNSFEAKANNVVVVILQERGRFRKGQKNVTLRATEIFVIDDGTGMEGPTANFALSFGAGTRTERSGMGRFGMGLPQASVSQARRVDVWTWQSAFGQALHTRIDLDEMADKDDISVPWPKPATRPTTRLSLPHNFESPGENHHPGAPLGKDIGTTDDFNNVEGEDHRPGIRIPDYLLDTGVADEIFKGQGASHGTIVAWSKIDRTNWTTAAGVADNLSFFLGRIYRHFVGPAMHTRPHRYGVNSAFDEAEVQGFGNRVLDVEALQSVLEEIPKASGGRLAVRVVTRSVDDDGTPSYKVEEMLDNRGDLVQGIDQNGYVRANDPLYLMKPYDTHLRHWERAGKDAPETNDPPFRSHKPSQVVFVQSKKKDDDRYYPVFISTTHSLNEARIGDHAGSSYLGKHAKRNQGLSIMRADRELMLLDALNDEPQRRFIGISVEFSANLDEVFGVTNNKQEATQLASALELAREDDNYKSKSVDDLVDAGKIWPDSPLAAIYPVAQAIMQRHQSAWTIVRGQKRGIRGAGPSDEPTNKSPETEHAAEVDLKADEQDLTVGEREAMEESTKEDFKPPSAGDILAQLEETTQSRPGAEDLYSADDIKELADWLSTGHAYAFLNYADDSDDAFFHVEEKIGVAEARGRSKIIWINLAHPLWAQYLNDLRLSDEELSNLGETELRRLVRQARGTIVNMLIAWLRVELSGDSESLRLMARTSRENWGKQARRYITQPDEDATKTDSTITDLLFS